MKKDDKEKNVGVVKINLLDFIEATQGRKCQSGMEKCPDKSANISYTIKTTPINNMGGQSECQSMMSADVQSVDSGCDSEYDFNDLN